MLQSFLVQVLSIYYLSDLIQSQRAQIYQRIYFIYYKHKLSRAFMNLNKTSTLKNKYNKYDYKNQITPTSYRSSSQVNSEQQKNRGKQSRTKIKRRNIQNSQITTDRFQFEDFQFPLKEIQDNVMKTSINKADQQKKEVVYLESLNCELKSCISSQEKQLNQLRIALNTQKKSINLSRHKQEEEEINNLRQDNLSLQQNFNKQAIQMQSLKKQILILKEKFEPNSRQSVTSMASSQIGESKVSRRAQYAKNYEVNAETVLLSGCHQCNTYKEQIESLREKYGNQFRRLQCQLSKLKEKEILFQVLQLQIQNKNSCIDYLRNELEEFQKKSNDLLRIVYALENKLEKRNRNNHPFLTPKWVQQNEHLEYFINRY